MVKLAEVIWIVEVVRVVWDQNVPRTRRTRRLDTLFMTMPQAAGKNSKESDPSSLISLNVLAFRPFCETFLIRVPFVFSESAVTSSDRHHRSKRQVEDKRVVCYYASWRTAILPPQNIDPKLCTHLIYAFGGLGEDDTIQPSDNFDLLEKGKNLERAAGSTHTVGAWSN